MVHFSLPLFLTTRGLGKLKTAATVSPTLRHDVFCIIITVCHTAEAASR
jgi:hypothetical protein